MSTSSSRNAARMFNMWNPDNDDEMPITIEFPKEKVRDLITRQGYDVMTKGGGSAKGLNGTMATEYLAEEEFRFPREKIKVADMGAVIVIDKGGRGGVWRPDPKAVERIAKELRDGGLTVEVRE